MAGRLQLSVVDLLVDFKRNGLNPPCQMVKGAIKQTVNVQTPEDFLCCSFGSPGSPHGFAQGTIGVLQNLQLQQDKQASEIR